MARTVMGFVACFINKRIQQHTGIGAINLINRKMKK